MSAVSESSATPVVEFVAFFEKNHKENEVFMFYLQWTGNETELTKLETFVSKANYEYMYGGHFSQVSMDLSVKLPESVVDMHCKVKCPMNDYYRMFTKCKGKFYCPFDSEDEELDEFELAKRMDETFYSTRIRNMFS